MSKRFLRGGAAGLILTMLLASPATAHDGHSHNPPQSPGPSGHKLEEKFPGWLHSDDFAVAGYGDTEGYHLTIAWEKERFIPRPLATIQPNGYDEDDWLGYECVTGDLKYAVVTVLPRRAVNHTVLRDRGGLLYSVRLSDGKVAPVTGGVAMKQHAVNCGAGSTAAALRHLGADQESSELLYIDAASATVQSLGVQDGQLTWPVPQGNGKVVAVQGKKLLEKAKSDSHAKVVGEMPEAPSKLAAGLSGIDITTSAPGAADVTVWHWHNGGFTKTGSGQANQVRLLHAAGAPNVVLGLREVDSRVLTAGTWPGDNGGREPQFASVRGNVLFTQTAEQEWNKYSATDGDLIASPATETTTAPAFTAMPARGSGTSVSTFANSTSPTCAVPRNNPQRQAYGPDNQQVQWAVEMASRNLLTASNSRPANYLQSGLPAYSPSSDFHLPDIKPSGSGKVPPVVMNAILAQENNYRHASRRSLPGSGGNPAIADYYGSGGSLDLIDYDAADCGYGIAQVTSGMRLSDTSITPNGKAKIAIDYAENIQAGTKILVDKWNQLYDAGIRMNNSDPSIVENWYFAIWAYNTGVQPSSSQYGNTTGCLPGPTCTDNGSTGGNWGLGWSNNPMNPDYPAQRTFFLRSTYADAAHPSDWPYQERVMGWMETPIHTYQGNSAYRAAKPVGSGAAQISAPPRDWFCSIMINSCDPTSSNGCLLSNYHCWWNQPAAYPLDCATTCHTSEWTYLSTAPEPAAANPWAPACDSDLGSNAIIVDDLPNPAYNLFCPSRNWSNGGTFTYAGGSLGMIDFHQLATGFGGHTWFTGNRLSGDLDHQVAASWLPNSLAAGVYTVKVHIPRAGASAGSAVYKVTLADGSVRRIVINQHEHYNHWKSLGVFSLGSNAKVVLDNVTQDDTQGGKGTVAFDSVAFVPTPGTFVQHKVEAIAYFDEDIALTSNPPVSWVTGILGTGQVAYDWANNSTSFLNTMATCSGTPSAQCVAGNTQQALSQWRANVLEAGTGSGSNHPAGKSIMQWMALSNSYGDRPINSTMPDGFRTIDDSNYKLRSSATVSYVLGTDGKIVAGSQDVVYDDRTADTHLPKFVVDFMRAIGADYGITEPNLSYSMVGANEYRHESTGVNPNINGVLPGRAYAHAGMTPQVLDGTCISVGSTAGGMIGYRPMINTGYVPAAVDAWRTNIAQSAVVPDSVKQLARDIYSYFFEPTSVTSTTNPLSIAVLGSPFGVATPIWQDLRFKMCTDGKVYRVRPETPVLQVSHMPNQYLYLDQQAIDLNGTSTSSSQPVIFGDFARFTNMPDPTFALPNQFFDCGPQYGQSGNPWGLDPPLPGAISPDFNPITVHPCSNTDYAPISEFPDFSL